jgi:ABC-type sugar transport system ATPase subunit
MAAAVEFKGVSKSFGRHTLIQNMDMTIPEGQFTVIFGAPGSGKSTLLRLITGLEKPDTGEIYLRDTPMNGTPPGERNIGYVPQSFALYPHYNVYDNIAYPLKLMGMRPGDFDPIVGRTAELLQITHLLAKKPDQCSGGEKQRIAIARGIVKNTRIFILDDPLTGLDFKLREQLFDDLRQMQSDMGATFIFTTSDALETLILAQEVRIFDQGHIVEAGQLVDVYSNPQRLRTAALLGFPPTNVFDAKLEKHGGGLVCYSRLLDFPISTDSSGYHGPAHVTLRPQDIMLNPSDGAAEHHIDGEITLVESLGAELVAYLDVNGLELEAVVPYAESGDLNEGPVTLGVNTSSLMVYAADGHRVGEAYKVK